MISWMRNKQKFVSLNTVQAEYITASMTSSEEMWMRKLFGELFEHVLGTIMIYYDIKSGIQISKNYVFHDRSKLIEIRYHYIRDMVQRGYVGFHHISTNEKIVDILTKPFLKGKFLVFREQLGLMM